MKYTVRRFSLISRGLRFFKELSKIEKLPISEEDYAEFIYPELLGKQSLRNEEISKILNSYYKSPNSAKCIYKIGRGLLGSWSFENKINPFNISNERTREKLIREGIKFSYTHLQKLPKRYIIDSLGAGGFGCVFDYPFGRIEKISYKGFIPEEMRFYRYLLKNPLPIFPKIYTLEKDQVVMEKLLVDTSKLKELKEFLTQYVKGIQTDLFPYREVDWDKINSELGKTHWFTKFIQEVENGLFKIYGIKTVGDLSHKNVGQRKETGELVFFDPVGGKILMK